MSASDPYALAPRRAVLVSFGAVLAAAVARPRPAWAQTPGVPLRIALVPYLSPRAMLTQFEPMRLHLERALGRPVEFYTASSFAALLESVRTAQQPFTLMPMHLARLAVADWGHVLALRSTRESQVQLLAPRSLGLGAPDTLRGRKVAVIDPLAITTLQCRRWLRAQRLDDAVTLVPVPSISSATLALGQGQVDAMVATEGQTLDVPWLRPDELTVVAVLGRVLGPGFLAHRDVPAAELTAFRKSMAEYEPPAGRVGASGAAYVEGSPSDLEPYEPLAAEVRRQLPASALQRP